jgi:outer membrane biosynthesis protein TonB
MIDIAAMARAVRCALALACLLAAGCAGMKHAQPQEPVQAAAPVAPATVAEQPAPIAPESETVPAVVETPETSVQSPPMAPVRPPAPAPAPPAAVPKAPTTTPAAKVATPPKPPAVVATAPATAPPVPKVAAAPVASPPVAAPLDLKSLETRLRQTRAIGVMTKLSLKNQVDDLLARFRAYHKRQATTTLAELRRSYDMLLLKVLSLLQDSDPPLARDIVKSRAAIWSILEDPRKFTESNLMAGATP